MIRGRSALLWIACAGLAACSHKPSADHTDAGDAPPWATSSSAPAPRPGMVWIPPGPLVAGTPYGKTPRVPDEEMPGDTLVMHGFYIDVYMSPNEPGALPQTNITQADAAAACASQGKRLCTELELERACKGPQNSTYEYGDAYRASTCGTGAIGRSPDSAAGTAGAAMAAVRPPGPNGLSSLCASPFGVHDLHGSAWTWTASPWKRDPAKTGLVTIRGGNGPLGELYGRCANGRGVKPDAPLTDVGFRCCAGEPNPYEVTIEVARGEPLTLKGLDPKLAPAVEKLAETEPSAPKTGHFTVERVWVWRPFGNEELWVGGGCSETIRTRSGKQRRAGCGVMLVRAITASAGADAPEIPHAGTPVSLGFVATDRWQPTLSLGDSSRDVLLYGGDASGPFRRRLTYDWGKVTIGPVARRKEGKGDIYE